MIGVTCGVGWLANFFYKMPKECRRATLIPIYNNKKDIQKYINYYGILMSQEKRIECKLIHKTPKS